MTELSPVWFGSSPSEKELPRARVFTNTAEARIDGTQFLNRTTDPKLGPRSLKFFLTEPSRPNVNVVNNSQAMQRTLSKSLRKDQKRHGTTNPLTRVWLNNVEMWKGCGEVGTSTHSKQS